MSGSRFGLGFFILSLIAVLFGVLGFASSRGFAAEPALNCGTAFKSVQYSANFKYNWNEQAAPLAVKFGTVATPQGPQHVAKIENAGRCQATCTITRWTRVEESAEPLSAELTCTAPGFRALSQSLTVFWVHPKSGGPTLRIGKWLDGYEETPLRVVVDKYSTHGPSGSELRVRQIAAIH